MKVASIEKIQDIKVHSNADSLELATVLGWQIVVKKGEFKKDDLVVYINIDSVVEPHPALEFLANKKYMIRPIRLRGEISQGLCLPLRELFAFSDKNPEIFSSEEAGKSWVSSLTEGTEISNVIGAKHYEKPVPACLAGVAKGNFPSFLVKTDEDNLRNYPQALSEIVDKDVYYTMKMDGSSGTFYVKDGSFGVCSRNMELKETEDNSFWQIAKKYNLQEKMLNTGRNLCIQAEVYGPGIQGNPTGAKAIDLSVFNLFDIDTGTYYGLNDITEFCKQNELPMVRVLYIGKANTNIDDLVACARDLKYENGKKAEGMVIRTVDPVKSIVLGTRRWSGKVLNELYEI